LGQCKQILKRSDKEQKKKGRKGVKGKKVGCKKESQSPAANSLLRLGSGNQAGGGGNRGGGPAKGKLGKGPNLSIERTISGKGKNERNTGLTKKTQNSGATINSIKRRYQKKDFRGKNRGGGPKEGQDVGGGENCWGSRKEQIFGPNELITNGGWRKEVK